MGWFDYLRRLMGWWNGYAASDIVPPYCDDVINFITQSDDVLNFTTQTNDALNFVTQTDDELDFSCGECC